MREIRKAVGAIYDAVGDYSIFPTPENESCMEAAITAALAACDADGWQPIETAPKDGDHVLAWVGRRPFVDGEPLICRYWPEGELWVTADEMEDDVYPTHWMPLPAAPGEKEESL